MSTMWKHPKLGRFDYGGHAWRAFRNLPALKKFSYDTGYDNAPRSTGTHLVALLARDEKQPPSAAQVKLALAVVENQDALVAEIARALWEEFNGRGPVSGMWWHGALKDIARQVESKHVRRLAGPDDVAALLQVESVIVHREYDDYPGPIGEITFHAAFEQEHGVSVLTDGRSALGCGYALEPSLYEPEPGQKSKRGTGGK